MARARRKSVGGKKRGPKKGYKQTAAHIRARVASRMRGRKGGKKTVGKKRRKKRAKEGKHSRIRRRKAYAFLERAKKGAKKRRAIKKRIRA